MRSLIDPSTGSNATSLVVGFNGGVNHATLTSSVNPLTAEPGQHILFSPRWTANAVIDYSQALGNTLQIGRAHV